MLNRSDVDALKLERWESVRVEWVDSAGYSTWKDIDDLEAQFARNTYACSTVGQWFGVNDLAVCVVGSRDHDKPNVDNAMMIPLVAVMRIIPLVPLEPGA